MKRNFPPIAAKMRTLIFRLVGLLTLIVIPFECENKNSLNYLIDVFIEMDEQDRNDTLKFVDRHIAAELRDLPAESASLDPAVLKRLRERISYHSAIVSIRESIKYMYVRDVLSHATQHFVKLDRAAAKKKLPLNKRMLMDFLQDPQASGTGPIIRKLLLEKNISVDDFSDFMLWVFDFTHDWLDFFRRIPRNESVDPTKYNWPFTKRHLDFVNIFRQSLNQDPLEMVWLDEQKDLVLPQIVIADHLVAGTGGSWERLGLT